MSHPICDRLRSSIIHGEAHARELMHDAADEIDKLAAHLAQSEAECMRLSGLHGAALDAWRKASPETFTAGVQFTMGPPALFPDGRP